LIGVFNTDNGPASSFVLTTSDFGRGDVSIVAQSGGVAMTTYAESLEFDGNNFNKVTSIGNKLLPMETIE